jgi:pyrroloquinoline quinone biosynthesis protein E
MNGWGNVFLTITPDGTALPCHTAAMLPGLDFPNVKDSSVREIWFESEGFNRYRGNGWMKEPCKSCSEQQNDLGGCRCQAFMLAGDPAMPDPVCDKSPHHQTVLDAVERAQLPDEKKQIEKPLIFRDPKSSLALSGK